MSKQDEQTLRLKEFLNSSDEVSDFVVRMRGLQHAAITLHLRDEDNEFSNEIKEGNYWLNALIEALDPPVIS